MRNVFLKQYEYANVSDFTSDAGLKIRKAINPLWRAILKQCISRKVYVESYPKLDRKKRRRIMSNTEDNAEKLSKREKIQKNIQ